MKFSRFVARVQQILTGDLPGWDSVVAEGREIAQSVHIGRTAFMDKFGVSSESEYKHQCIRNGTITYHAHIGLSTWSATAKALRHLQRAAQECDFNMDRAGICLDRRMGLPEQFRHRVPSETGPMLCSEADWREVGQCAPIQPHLGDFMIGFPASTANTIQALTAGVTTIGNLSQFFAHEVPTWKDIQTTAIETTRAIAILGALRKKGVVLHSYLEDGFGAMFSDCATVAAWALLERYLIEALLGCKLVHCIGGLTTDPIKRAGWIFAMHQIHEQNCLGSMIYGDTISFTPNFAQNQAVVGEYLLWDIMAQIECPTGHAVLPLPVTEALRIPSIEEIVEAQQFGRRIESAARRLHPRVDFGPSYEFAEKVVFAGRAIFDRALAGFTEAGADIRNPLQMLYLLKKLGPTIFEETFSTETRSTETRSPETRPIFPANTDLVVPTDVYLMSQSCFDENREVFTQPKIKAALEGRRLLIAATDVHQNAIRILDQLLSLSGACVTNIGAEKDPDEIAARAKTAGADAILVSTHNGNALQYAQVLREELNEMGLKIPVIMGGRLNQKIESAPLPVNVSTELKALGFMPCTRLDHPFQRLLNSGGWNGE